MRQKEIYLIYSTNRVKGTKEQFSCKEVIYACENLLEAIEDCKRLNEEEKLKVTEFLEFHYIYESTTLYLKKEPEE